MSANPICFDARMAQASGIGTYIRNLLSAFQEHQPSLRLTLLTDKNHAGKSPWPSIPLQSQFYSVAEQVTVPWAFSQSKADLLHVPHYNIPILHASRCIVTVHDLIHLKFPEFLPSRLALMYAKAFFHGWIPKTRAILSVSESTKRDMVTLLGIPESKITVTHPGVPKGFYPMDEKDYAPILRSFNLQRGYFLYVGNLKEFKNTPRLIEAYRLLKTRHPDAPPFVLVGRNFIAGFEEVLKHIPGIQWLREIDQKQLVALYSGALALVFPSLYEGFGLPPLEAMASGTPVICSNRGSLPEVVGEAAVLVDPLSIEDIQTGMKRLYQEPGLATQLSKKGLDQSRRFSWKTTAEKTVRVYHGS